MLSNKRLAGWCSRYSLLLLCLAIASVGAFNRLSRPQLLRTNAVTRLASQANTVGSYQELLKRAQLDSGKGSSNSSPTKAAPQQPQQQRQVAPPQQPLEAPIPSLSGNRDGLPFSDELYDHLKFAIEKLSARIKSDTALTPQELERFKVSVDRIVLDAHIPNVAVKTFSPAGDNVRGASSSTSSAAARLDATNPNQAQYFKQDQNSAQLRRGAMPPRTQTIVDLDDEDEDAEDQEVGADNALPKPFSTKDDSEADVPEWLGNITGVKNSWNVPGMEDMTTEEYYRAVNSRISDMKNKRMAAGMYDRDPGRNYLDGLSKSNRSS